MKSIKQQFDDFRSNTPKHVQWLLGGAAFIIFVILLFLIFGNKSSDDNLKDVNQDVSFNIQPKEIDFTNVIVGESDNQNVSVDVNTPVVLDSINIDVADITTTNNCDDLIDSCLINVIYKPHAAHDVARATLNITWHAINQEDVIRTESIPVLYSANEALIPVEEPEPELEPEEPDQESEPEPEPEPVFVPEEKTEQIAEEIKEIAPVEVFVEEPTEYIQPIEIKKTELPKIAEKEEFSLPPEKCSDFAIPGYNQAGIQIGWIKPEHGANYFHPFSDKDCNHPTGKYDFSTGIITSLTDGSKIGTDANHIGYRNIRNNGLSLPALSEPKTSAVKTANGKFENAIWDTDEKTDTGGKMLRFSDKDAYEQKYNKDWGTEADEKLLLGSAQSGEYVTSSPRYDRTFILRQFKPIPATIVSEVRADPSVYGYDKGGNKLDDQKKKNHSIPVRATVDRNVFSDDGRTIIIPTGTLLMGYLDGELPGPYQSIGRMNIKWYQFIRPDGVEFNFENENQDPYSADAQGRVGVPGHGSTDYIEQMVMPILTSLVPAAVNMIAPIADTVINQINLDSNTIVQSGTIRSSEMAKQEVIDTWNKVAQKLLVDVMSNTTPPFSIAAGTRINVFSPVDLIVSCASPENTGKKCAVIPAGSTERRKWSDIKDNATFDSKDSSWVGQVRSFNLVSFCKTQNGKVTIGDNWAQSGYDYRTVYAYCESQNYQAKNNAKQAVYNQNLKNTAENKYGTFEFNQTDGTFSQGGTAEQQKAYNQDILGLKYNEDDGTIINPFAKTASAANEIVADENVLTCEDGTAPDANGCCIGETFTDMGDMGWNCCPDSGGDCFPPITME
jgi:hypothetical protein